MFKRHCAMRLACAPMAVAPFNDCMNSSCQHKVYELLVKGCHRLISIWHWHASAALPMHTFLPASRGTTNLVKSSSGLHRRCPLTSVVQHTEQQPGSTCNFQTTYNRAARHPLLPFGLPAALPSSHAIHMEQACISGQGIDGMPAINGNAMQQPIVTECLRVDPASFSKSKQAGTIIDLTQQQPSEPSQQAQRNLNMPNLQQQEDMQQPAQTPTFMHDTQAIDKAAKVIQQGGLVAMPTETVYGLAADALNATAVRAIFAAKQRPPDNPLIIHISSIEMLSSLYSPGWTLPDVYTQIVAKYWPGPLTILLPRSEKVPFEVVCGQPTMAVRMPNHPVALALISRAGTPLAAPSANSSGKPSPTLAAHVMSDLAGKIPLVLDGGQCMSGVESTVLDGLRSPPVVLRPGGVTYEQLTQFDTMQGLQVYKKHFVDEALEQAPTTPGMKYRHYSPQAPITLLDIHRHVDDNDQKAICSAAELQVKGLVCQLSKDLRKATADHSTVKLVNGHTDHVASTKIGVLRTTKGSNIKPGLIEGNQACQYGLVNSNEPGTVELQVVEYVLGDYTCPETVARELFRALRLMDELNAAHIVAEGVVETDEGLAVMNRLRKAATHTVDLKLD